MIFKLILFVLWFWILLICYALFDEHYYENDLDCVGGIYVKEIKENRYIYACGHK